MKSQIIAQKLSSHYVFESDCLSFSLYKFLLSEDKIGTRGYQFIDFISGLTENDVVIIDEIGKKFLEMNLPSKNSMLNTIFLEPWQLNKSELLLLIKPDKSKRYFNFMSRYSDRCIVKEILDKQSVKSFLIEEVEKIDLTTFPIRCWVSKPNTIYPIKLPTLEIEPDLDLLVVDPPARNLALLPNGIAYLEVALKKSGARFQILDLDIIAYHLFHMHRIFDVGEDIQLSDGTYAPSDPWLAHNYDSWSSLSEHDSALASKLAIHDFFEFLLNKASEEIIQANPKFLGLSVQQCNEVSGGLLVNKLKSKNPNLRVIVGGFSCYNADIGLRGVPFADFMCIGEADLTIGGLIQKLLNGELPKNLPGILSRWDDVSIPFSPAPMIHDLDKIEFPRYSWTSLDVYRNWDGYALIPIIASRGCRWSRCTFCAERFYWRIRSAENFVDELEWLVEQGSFLFMFNESDLNGMPERVLEICDEIIRRGLNHKIKLTGQLRIHRKSDKAFFNKLKEAGFVALRFGVDSFSANGLRMQQKGYTKAIVSQNLKDCSDAGIYIEVNWVIGVPGETENDIDEGIDFILENKNYIGRLANLNPLIMVNGSVYWMDPEQFKIKFKSDKSELYNKYPRAIPASEWWSEEPFIDAATRQKWFHKVVTKLYEEGFPIGDWALQVIDDVESQKDKARTATYEENSIETKEVNQSLAADLLLSTESFAEPPSDIEKNLKFIKMFNSYRIYQLVDSFIGIHSSQEDLTSTASHMFRSQTISEVEAHIEKSLNWANTRGTYKNSSKEHHMALRVDSSLIAFNDMSKSHLSETDLVWKDLKKNYYATKVNVTPKRLPKSKMRISNFASHTGSRKSIKELLSNLIPSQLHRSSTRSAIDFFEDLNVVQVATSGAVPELISSWDEYKINIVKFDGKFYVLNHGDDVDFSGLTFFSENLHGFEDLKVLIDSLGLSLTKQPKNLPSRAQSISTKVPTLLREINGFNIVEYEGFFHAIPIALGPIDLEKTDVMQHSEIFRDVSLSAVEDFALGVNV